MAISGSLTDYTSDRFGGLGGDFGVSEAGLSASYGGGDDDNGFDLGAIFSSIKDFFSGPVTSPWEGLARGGIYGGALLGPVGLLAGGLYGGLYGYSRAQQGPADMSLVREVFDQPRAVVISPAAATVALADPRLDPVLSVLMESQNEDPKRLKPGEPEKKKDKTPELRPILEAFLPSPQVKPAGILEDYMRMFRGY